MTVWSTPVPTYLQGAKTIRDGDFGDGDFAAAQTLAPGVEDVLTAEGARVPVRRHSLGSVPSAQHVDQANAKWLDFAPTSPQRRNSFVTEPGAVEGNPFDIYKEPDTNNDGLRPNTFYSAGASYSVNERPVLVSSDVAFDSPSRPATLRAEPAVVSFPPAPASAPPQPSRPTALPPTTTPLCNPFDVPMSPVRYNKPAPKVVLSPGQAHHVNSIFSDLDPFKRLPSPRSSVPLDTLKKQQSGDFFGHNSSSTGFGAPQQQPQQAQQQQAFGGWGMDPFATQPPRQLQVAQPQQQAAFGAPFGGAAPFGPTGGWGQPFLAPVQPTQGPVAAYGPGHPHNPAPPSFNAHGFSPIKKSISSSVNGFGGGSMQPWSPKKQQRSAAAGGSADDGFGFSFDAPPSSLSPFKSGSSGGGPANDGFLDFDPVAVKSKVASSFDVGSAKYFGQEEDVKRGHAEYDDDDDNNEGHQGQDDEDDGSLGEGVAFEVQDDQFLDDGPDGGARGNLYDVVFTAPTQFGMLLERKDEWTRGDVQRRERTVVTLVVEGGEAEAKGVSVGSMLVSINHTDVRSITYKETLEMVKDGTRPMRIVFERESPKDEVIQGYYFVSKGPFFSTPTTMAKWKRKYVVLGGPIAKKNVLQVYDSKKAYHATVVALFQRRRPTHRVKTYALTYAFKCTDLAERRIEGNSAPLKIFSFMTPTAKFKAIRVASESRKNVETLYEKIKKYTGKK